VGKITKQWSGLAKEYFTDADNFGIQFPVDLDVKMKAVMLGACFLIVSSLCQPCINEITHYQPYALHDINYMALTWSLDFALE